jgi:hypothetical protein
MRYGVLDLTAVVDGSGIPAVAQEDFIALMQALGPAFGKLAAIGGIDQLAVECVLAEDFVNAVEARMRRFDDSDQGGFTTDRIGGVVAAKNLPQADDDSHVAIVFAADVWVDSGNPPLAQKTTIMAHELAHPVMSRVRRMSGALDGVIFPSRTATEIARSSARIDWDEFRAEAIADVVLQGMATTTEPDGESRPLRLADILMADYAEQAKIHLASAYPAWADRVQKYREWELSLGDMWSQTLQQLGQTRTLVARMLGCAGAESDKPVDVQVSALPAYRLYFGEPWEAYVNAMRGARLVTTVNEHLEVEREVLDLGEASFRHALRALGVTASELPNRQSDVRVVEPQRV